jgi:hypothetical protein
MDSLVERLIEQETLDGEEFRRIVAAADSESSTTSDAGDEAIAAVG